MKPHLPSSSSASKPGRRTTLSERQFGMAILFAALLCIGMGQSLFFALLPPVARDLGLSEIQVSSIFTLSALLWVVMSPFWGSLSDRWGRKPIIITGILGFGVSTGGFGLLLVGGHMGLFAVGTLFVLMIVVRGVFGLFGSGAPSAAQAYIADRTNRMQRAKGMAAIGAAFGMGTVIGPGFAALLTFIHFLAPFLILGVLSIFMAIFIYLRLPERRLPHRDIRAKQSKLSVFDSRIFPFLFMGVGMSLLQAAVMQVAAFFVMDTLHFNAVNTTQIVGFGMMSMAVATLITQLIIIPRANLSIRAMMFIGGGVSLIGVCLLLVPMNTVIFILALFLQGFGRGFLGPAVAAGASLAVKPNEQGAVAGYLSSTAAVGVVFLPVIVMPLYLVNHVAPFWLAAFVTLSLLFVAWKQRTPELERPHNIELSPPQPQDPAKE